MENSNVNLTQIAMQNAYDSYDLDESLRFLLQDFPIRRTEEEFAKSIASKAVELNMPLADLERQLRMDLGAVNFSNWKKGKPISRDSAVKIAYALHMGGEEAQSFLTHSCWLEGFYYRDCKDVIYLYGLDNHWSYEQAKELIAKYAWLDSQNPEPEAAGINNLTETLKNKYDKAFRSDAEFEAYLVDNSRLFGSFRRTAYERFKEMIGELEKYGDYENRIDNEIGKEALREKGNGIERVVDSQYYRNDHDDISYDEICKEIAMGIPNVFKGKENVLKAIAGNVPIRSTMSEILNKTVDKSGNIKQAPRKYLVLAWLMLNGANPDFDEGDNKEADFKECITSLNDHLLKPCGMHLLDFRNPFDWMVVNALRTAYFDNDEENDDAVERIQRFVQLLFNEG